MVLNAKAASKIYLFYFCWKLKLGILMLANMRRLVMMPLQTQSLFNSVLIADFINHHNQGLHNLQCFQITSKFQLQFQKVIVYSCLSVVPYIPGSLLPDDKINWRGTSILWFLHVLINKVCLQVCLLLHFAGLSLLL